MTIDPNNLQVIGATVLSATQTAMESAGAIGDPCGFMDVVPSLLREVEYCHDMISGMGQTLGDLVDAEPEAIQPHAGRVLDAAVIYEALSVTLADVEQLSETKAKEFQGIVRKAADRAAEALGM